MKPQNEFPFLQEFREKFPITHDTIFAWNNVIYTNNDLPYHIVVHEQTHHKQQEKYSLEFWKEHYLNDNEFRLQMEIEAYRAQLKYIKDRNARRYQANLCARDLSSPLYGNLITKEEALKKIL